MSYPERQRSLDRQRQEVRFYGTSSPLSGLEAASSLGLHETVYQDPVNNSIYLASTRVQTDRGSVRLRFRSAHSSQHELQVLDSGMLTTLEVKLRPKSNGTDEKGERINKYRIENIPLGIALAAVGHPEKRHLLDSFPNGSRVRRMIELLYDREPLEPLVMVEAERRHFVTDEAQDPARVTLDTNVRYWLPNVYRGGVFYGDGMVYARRTDLVDANLVEIKRAPNSEESEDLDPTILMELFGPEHDYQIGGRTKRNQGILAFLTYGRPIAINPEFQKTGDTTIDHVEREKKLDVATDPRDAISAMPYQLSEGVYVGPSASYSIFMRYISRGDQVVVEKSLTQAFATSAFQVKADVVVDDVLVRRERTRGTLEEAFEAESATSSGGETAQSSIGERARLERIILCVDTGNLFGVLADHCTAVDRAPLEQVEVEYLGKISFLNMPPQAADEEELARDFARVNGLVASYLNESGVSVLPTQTTKQEWLTR